MNGKVAIDVVLRAVDDRSTAQPYGDGVLIDLPLTYCDGDAVRLLVEPVSDGYRVTDRAAAATLLSLAGVDLDHGRLAGAITEAARLSGLNSINEASGELVAYGTEQKLGELILAVALASTGLEQRRVVHCYR
ncbi:hypothetical protein [Micromonospora sp. NBC_01813]|uniref:hypothetical protein n=1 Tax=Micromonospora sp. NBC_01813 TaxID=2975988 RepID=UPI002DDAAC1A|nr:hypothetical protein [Micromonospora sp. NBC_01813]WSA08144.1 hypothetical protein OG958_28700 [Micromonospora sp. NBC_01813]